MREQIISILGLDPAVTDDEIVAAITLLKAAEQATKDGAKNMVAMAFAGNKISKEERDLCNELLKTNPAFVVGKMTNMQPSGTGMGAPSIVSLIGGAGNATGAMTGVTGLTKPKAEWTLQDYRKHAPGELQANPGLYEKLCQKAGL